MLSFKQSVKIFTKEFYKKTHRFLKRIFNYCYAYVRISKDIHWHSELMRAAHLPPAFYPYIFVLTPDTLDVPPMIISPSLRVTIVYLVINLDAEFARGARGLLFIPRMLVDMSGRGRSVCIVSKRHTRMVKDWNKSVLSLMENLIHLFCYGDNNNKKNCLIIIII